GGKNIGVSAVETADINNDGRADIITADADPSGSGFTGFTVTQWTGSGANLAVASQGNFSTGDGIQYQSVALGYRKNDGTFVTFNNDSQTDVLLGTNSGIFGSNNTLHSQFVVFQNQTPTMPTGRNVEFLKTELTVTEGSALDVTVVRGTASTGQVLVPFSAGGTAVQGGPSVKNGDYAITDPPYQSQTITFGPGEFQ